MENSETIRIDIQELASKVQDIKTLQIVRNILELELQDENEVIFSEELKLELEKRKVSHVAGQSASYSIDQVEDFARNRKK